MGDSPTVTGGTLPTLTAPAPTVESAVTSDGSAASEPENPVSAALDPAAIDDPPSVASDLSSGAFSTTRSTGPVGRMATATMLSCSRPDTSNLYVLADAVAVTLWEQSYTGASPIGPPCSGWLIGLRRRQTCNVAGVDTDAEATASVRVVAVVPASSSKRSAENAVGAPPPPPWTSSPRLGTSGGPGTETGTGALGIAPGLVTVHQPWSRGAAAPAGAAPSPIVSMVTAHASATPRSLRVI